MNKALGWILLLGGIVIIAIVVWGRTSTTKKTDIDYLHEAMLEQQAAEAAKAENAAALSQKVLVAPDACDSVTTGFIFNQCEREPDIGDDWPDWTEIANADEQTCMLAAFHQTNAHALAIRGEPHEVTVPDTNRMGRFISDVCGASLFTDGVDWGDQNVVATLLLNGFYADRAQSRVMPSQDY